MKVAGKMHVLLVFGPIIPVVPGMMSNLEEYKKLEKLGEGAYGIVYKAKNLKTGEVVALKKIHWAVHRGEGVPSTTLREVVMLRELKHPNVVNLLDVHLEENQLMLIFEFMSMDLKKYFDLIPPGQKVDPKIIKSYTFQLLQGLLFCHTRRVIHRDLKPQNILIDDKGVIKIADFGLTRAVAVPVRVYTHEIATLWYRAPEILLGAKRYTYAVDMWSMGCVFAEMFTKKPLFPGDSEIDQIYQIFRMFGTPTEKTWGGVTELENFKEDLVPQWNSGLLSITLGCIPKEAFQLLEGMFNYNPAMRMSARNACKHPYFNDLDKSILPAPVRE